MTLVEVLAVVVILGLIAGTLLVGMSGTLGQARHELARTGIGVIVNSIEKYNMTHESYPGDLSVLSQNPKASYYLQEAQLRDPWDRAYGYTVPGPGGHPYEVVCFGADGELGGTDDGADVSSTALGEKEPS
jgi:general secretion pathway protein G